MARKSFKVGNRVIGKISGIRGRLGNVVALNRGPNAKLIAVKWADGEEVLVTSRAIDVSETLSDLDFNEREDNSSDVSDDANDELTYFSENSENSENTSDVYI